MKKAKSPVIPPDLPLEKGGTNLTPLFSKEGRGRLPEKIIH
jgi:hypothetical protein